MTNQPNDGGPAFPVVDALNEVSCSGMSLRDWFAGMAMQGIYASDVHNQWRAEKAAKSAYRTADAMLKAREQQ